MTEPVSVTAPRAAKLIITGVALLLLVLLGGPLTRFIQTSTDWLAYPFPRAGSEGLILSESLVLKSGGNIYSPITPTSFISGPYPPLYYLAAAAVTPAQPPPFNNASDITSILRPGRIIALLSSLGAAALLVLLVIFSGGYHRHKKNIWPAALGGLTGGVLLLTLPQVTVWATRYRGDMLMIALTAAGLLAISAGAGEPPNSRWRVPLLGMGAVLFALAFFTKQTALAGPAASALYLLLLNRRSGLIWSAVMLGMVALPFALLDAATGHWFYLKMVVYHSLPFSRLTLERLLHFALWDSQWPLIIAAVAYSGFALRQWFTRNKRENAPFLLPLFVLASFVTLPTGGVVGADHNHLLMSGLAVSAAVGAALASSLSAGSPMRALPGFAVLSLVLMGYVFFTSGSVAWYGPDLNMPAPQETEQLRKIVAYAQNTPGQIFSDDPGIVALAGKRATFDDPFTMTALAQTGRWDESEFRTMLRQGRFALLVLECDVEGTLAQNEALKRGVKLDVARPCRSDTFTPGVLEAINSGYRVLFRDVRFTYVPR